MIGIFPESSCLIVQKRYGISIFESMMSNIINTGWTQISWAISQLNNS